MNTCFIVSKMILAVGHDENTNRFWTNRTPSIIQISCYCSCTLFKKPTICFIVKPYLCPSDCWLNIESNRLWQTLILLKYITKLNPSRFDWYMGSFSFFGKMKKSVFLLTNFYFCVFLSLQCQNWAQRCGKTAEKRLV